MLGTLTVQFTFDGTDIFGNPEEVVSSRCWRDGVELLGTTTMFSATNGEFVADDLDLPVGSVGGFELALVDNEGTTGQHTPFTVEVLDQGPTAPNIGSVVFAPKPVPTSS